MSEGTKLLKAEIVKLEGSGFRVRCEWEGDIRAEFHVPAEAIAVSETAGVVAELMGSGIYLRIKRDGFWHNLPIEQLTEVRAAMAGRGAPELVNWIVELAAKLNVAMALLAGPTP